MKVVFADSFYFVALINLNDQHHKKTVAIHRRLRERLVTTDWVLIEVADALAKGKARPYVAGLVHDLRQSADCEVISFSEDLFDKALNFYDQHRDKHWTLTDCASFVVMQERGITEALTGDHHFEQAGFIPLLK
jgi:predicted nucleic acid-binding protein